MHAFLAVTLTKALKPDELLRAEWVARVSALDLYVHELVSQGMCEIFEGRRPQAKGFSKFQVSGDGLLRIHGASSLAGASAAFDLEVRSRLSLLTYQDPDKIADGIRFISDFELWNEIALKHGATPATKIARAKALRLELSLIVERRNKIAHEGDLQPSTPRIPWPISGPDVLHVKNVIFSIVTAIDSII